MVGSNLTSIFAGRAYQIDLATSLQDTYPLYSVHLILHNMVKLGILSHFFSFSGERKGRPGVYTETRIKNIKLHWMKGGSFHYTDNSIFEMIVIEICFRETSSGL